MAINSPQENPPSSIFLSWLFFLAFAEGLYGMSAKLLQIYTKKIYVKYLYIYLLSWLLTPYLSTEM